MWRKMIIILLNQMTEPCTKRKIWLTVYNPNMELKFGHVDSLYVDVTEMLWVMLFGWLPYEPWTPYGNAIVV